ncbi:MAG: hypothetical protein ABI891_08000 [Acidobacteriota bacterium]
MSAVSNYQQYTEQAIANFAQKDAAKCCLLVDAVVDLKSEKVLDFGCGAGQELLPFLEKTGRFLRLRLAFDGKNTASKRQPLRRFWKPTSITAYIYRTCDF